MLSNGRRMQPIQPNVDYLFDEDFTMPVNAFQPNLYGLYNIAGNVEEMVDSYYYRDSMVFYSFHDFRGKYDQPWGVTKGGSWYETGLYLQYPIRKFYDDPNFSSKQMGFRLMMEVLEY